MPKETLILGESLINWKGCKEENLFSKEISGSPLISSINLDLAGGKSLLYSALGNDNFAKEIILTIKKKINTTGLVVKKNKMTTMSFDLRSQNGTIQSEYRRGADKQLCIKDITKADLKRCEIYLFNSELSMVNGAQKTLYQYVFEYGIQRNKYIIFNPKYRSGLYDNVERYIESAEPFLEESNLVKLNTSELMLISKSKTLEEGMLKIQNDYKGTFIIEDKEAFVLKKGLEELTVLKDELLYTEDEIILPLITSKISQKEKEDSILSLIEIRDIIKSEFIGDIDFKLNIPI